MTEHKEQIPRTLRQIAKAANVSLATVSYVLNGKGRVSDERRQHIESLLEAAGQKPKYQLQPIIYICHHARLSDITTFPPLLNKYEGLSEACGEAGLGVRLEFIHKESGSIADDVKRILQHKPGGIVLDSDLKEQMPEAVELFFKHNIPTIQLGHTIYSNTTDAVIVDDYHGAYTGTKHLIKQGHKRIATIRWSSQTDPASSRKHRGYVSALQDAKIPVIDQYIVESQPKRESNFIMGRSAVEQLLALPSPPTAVFVENSFISPALLYPVSTDERELPKAISSLDMVHFEAWNIDTIEMVMHGIFSYPPRNTKLLRIDWKNMAIIAGKRLVDRIRDNSLPVDVIRVSSRLIQINHMTSSVLLDTE